MVGNIVIGISRLNLSHNRSIVSRNRSIPSRANELVSTGMITSSALRKALIERKPRDGGQSILSRDN